MSEKSKVSEGEFSSSPQWLFRRETLTKGVGDKSIVNHHLAECGQEVFRKNLFAHFGCINAIEFSHDGELLVSGGDDRRVLLWNVAKAICKQETPNAMQAEHSSNIFSLAFDCTNTIIYSAGNDDQVIVHDIQTGVPLDYFKHEQPVFGVCGDPLSGKIFSSAGDDGRVLIYDTREANGEPFVLASSLSSFHAVMFHPTESRLILTANAKDGAALWDVRRPKVCLVEYTMDAGSCCMSARFNRIGTQILALRRRLPPILYNTSSKKHLFEFHHVSYYNSCTMKTCSFAGTNDEFVMSGSDNFDVHIWRIPRKRDEASRWVDNATAILKGHRSIVNQVRYNPSFNVIASSGVEKMVKLWSPFNIADTRCLSDKEGLISEPERNIYAHEEYIRMTLRSGHDPFMSLQQHTARNISEDSRMMAFFDALVQRDIAGLSDEDSSSAYTNTVYSSDESPTSISDSDHVILPTYRDIARYRQLDAEIALETNTMVEQQAVAIENTSQNSLIVSREGQDSDNEPTVEFDDLPLLNDEEHQSDDADDEDNVEDELPEDLEQGNLRQVERRQVGNLPRVLVQYEEQPQMEIRWGLRSDSDGSDRERTRSPPVSLGTHDPNRLTALISENSSRLSRREGMSKSRMRNRKRLLQISDSGSEDSVKNEQSCSAVTTRSPIAGIENNDSLRAVKPNHKKRPRTVTNPSSSSTPVYEMSTSSNAAGFISSNCPNSNYQLISDLMTRTPNHLMEGEEESETQVTRESSETDSSSFSSSTSSISIGQIRDLKKLSSSSEDRKRQKYAIRNRSVFKLPTDSSSDSDEKSNSATLKKLKSDQKKRKKPKDSSTPSDSGVDMSNYNICDQSERPCCSKSLTAPFLTKTESIASDHNEELEDSDPEVDDTNSQPQKQ